MSSPRRRVSVIGAGYVGTVTAVGVAGLGHEVELVETDPDRLAALQGGRLAIYEPGLLEGFVAAVDQGLLRVAAAPGPDAELFMICVAAPLDGGGNPTRPSSSRPCDPSRRQCVQVAPRSSEARSRPVARSASSPRPGCRASTS